MQRISCLFLLLCIANCGQKKIGYSEQAPDDNFHSFATEELKYIEPRDGLRIRKEPNIQSPVMAVVPYCTHVFQKGRTKSEDTISGKKGYWAKLRFDGPNGFNDVGWGFEPFLTASTPPAKFNPKDLNTFKQGCLSIDGGPACMGCGTIAFKSNGDFAIAYDCHLFGEGKWTIKGDIISVTSNSYLGNCGHFADRQACENQDKSVLYNYEFRLTDKMIWQVRTNVEDWKEKSYLNWSKEWNNVGNMHCYGESTRKDR